MKKISMLSFVLSLVSVALIAGAYFMKDDIINSTLHNNPEMVVNALQRYEEVAMEKQAKAMEENLKKNEKALHNEPSSPYVGPEKANATLVFFYDYSCGYCHVLYPALNEVIAKNPDVKFVFKPLTFLGQASEIGAKAVIAASKQGKFAEMNNELFSLEGVLTEEKAVELASKVGADSAQLKADMNSSYVKDALAKNSKLAGDIQVRGVPTMVLNGKLLQVFDAEGIQKAIDAVK